MVAEYGMEPYSHWLYRSWPIRKLLIRYEPFLEAFWREDMATAMQAAARAHEKRVDLVQNHGIFDGFYRVMVFKVERSLGHQGSHAEGG